MFRLNRLFLPLTILIASSAFSQSLPKPLPAPASQDAKMKWFRDAKFRVHSLGPLCDPGWRIRTPRQGLQPGKIRRGSLGEDGPGPRR